MSPEIKTRSLGSKANIACLIDDAGKGFSKKNHK
jgi:hypothetical protein